MVQRKVNFFEEFYIGTQFVRRMAHPRQVVCVDSYTLSSAMLARA